MTPPKDNAGLMPCPLCSGDARIDRSGRNFENRKLYFIECRRKKCGIKTKANTNLQRVIDTWQTRAPSESVKPDAGWVDVDELAKVRAELKNLRQCNAGREYSEADYIYLRSLLEKERALSAQGHLAQTAVHVCDENCGGAINSRHCSQSGDDAGADSLIDPDMPSQELRLHMGELTENEMLVARAAIRWANTKAALTAKPDLSALIAEVMEILNRDNFIPTSSEDSQARAFIINEAREKLTAALKDKGVV